MHLAVSCVKAPWAEKGTQMGGGGSSGEGGGGEEGGVGGGGWGGGWGGGGKGEAEEETEEEKEEEEGWVGGAGDVGARSMDHTPRRPHPRAFALQSRLQSSKTALKESSFQLIQPLSDHRK